MNKDLINKALKLNEQLKDLFDEVPINLCLTAISDFNSELILVSIKNGQTLEKALKMMDAAHEFGKEYVTRAVKEVL